MNWKAFFIMICIVVPGLLSFRLHAQSAEIQLLEEDRSFWDDVLADGTIQQKNLFYAGYIAYRENLNELSMESFRETVIKNPSNEIVRGISSYYIGKNLIHLGKYDNAISEFNSVQNLDLARFNTIKFAVIINTAVAYHRLNNREKFRENLQRVISTDIEGKYKRIALDMLSR